MYLGIFVIFLILLCLILLLYSYIINCIDKLFKVKKKYVKYIVLVLTIILFNGLLVLLFKSKSNKLLSDLNSVRPHRELNQKRGYKRRRRLICLLPRSSHTITPILHPQPLISAHNPALTLGPLETCKRVGTQVWSQVKPK